MNRTFPLNVPAERACFSGSGLTVGGWHQEARGSDPAVRPLRHWVTLATLLPSLALLVLRQVTPFTPSADWAQVDKLRLTPTRISWKVVCCFSEKRPPPPRSKPFYLGVFKCPFLNKMVVLKLFSWQKKTLALLVGAFG